MNVSILYRDMAIASSPLKKGGVEDFGSRDKGGMGVGLDKRIQGELKEKEIIQGGGLRF